MQSIAFLKSSLINEKKKKKKKGKVLFS